MTTQTYIDLAARKREQVNALIPKEWRLDDKYIPVGMRQTAEESVYNIDDIKDEYRTPLTEIPRLCGILSSRELHITEGYDVEGLLREMANKRLSAEEVVTAFCKRSAIAQQLTRCITEPLFTNALAEARELDTHLARTGQPIGPLHGLPVSVKDSFNVKGIDSSLGVTALCFKPASEDAALVQLLRSLGAIIVAKTNIPQTLALLDSVNHVFGRTLNPVYARLTPGGSSGGEGVLVTMRGSMIGFGTDVGGSIRVPAMCNNIYGFKPSVGRISYQGQTSFGQRGITHVALKAVAGPIARSVRDIDTVMKELVPRATVFADDCIPAGWCPSPRNSCVAAAAPTKPKLRIGILRHDGLVMPLPPILNILEEVSGILIKSKIADIEVVDVPTPAIMKQCFANAGRLMGVDGGNAMLDLITSTGEPLVPSLKGTKRRTPYTLEKLCALNAEREEIESEMRKSLWSMPASTRTTSSATSLSLGDRDRIDAIVLPLAAHPVPRHDQYGSVSYTSTLNLLDYPAGAIPVRKMTDRDLKLDFNTGDKMLSKWDAENRKLWQGNRSIYLNTPLSVQVITPKLHDYELCHAMGVIDAALKVHYGQKHSDRAML